MATTTTAKTATKPSPGAKLTTTVLDWKNAENAAEGKIWRIIKECRFLLEKKHSKEQVRNWLIDGIREAWGDEGVKTRQAHISKIMKISVEAAPDDMHRWEENKTGFYNAYNEFAKPQEHPAKKNGDIVGAGAAPQHQVKKVGEDVPTSSGEFVAGEAQIAKQNEVLADPDAMASEQTKAAMAKVKPPAEAKPEKPGADPTVGWVALLDSNRGDEYWYNLIKGMMEAKCMSIQKMVKVFEIVHTRSEIMVRGVVERLMQEPNFAALVVDFIRDNITLFDGLEVQEHNNKKMVEHNEESDEEEDDDTEEESVE